jgi:hypothetical protein
MIKRAYPIQMAYKVPETEKHQAQKALLYFNNSSKLLTQASDHLNIMKTPFKDNPDMTPEDIMKARPVIRRFRDTAIENFNKFKKSAFQCVSLMQTFATDTQTLKLMKAFINSVDELEIEVNAFSELFNDLESKDFSKNVVDNIEKIQKSCDDVEENIDERIKSHIQTNILATNWVDAISNDLQMKVEQKTPLILDLFNQRQQQLNDIIQDKKDIVK